MKYTTIQVTRDFLKTVRIFCAERGLKIAPTTELALQQFITASKSGSLVI